MTKLSSYYILILGIVSHLLLSIYSINYILSSKNNNFTSGNILFIIGHILIISNLIKNFVFNQRHYKTSRNVSSGSMFIHYDNLDKYSKYYNKNDNSEKINSNNKKKIL